VLTEVREVELRDLGWGCQGDGRHPSLPALVQNSHLQQRGTACGDKQHCRNRSEAANTLKPMWQSDVTL